MKPVRNPGVLTALAADEWTTRCDLEAAYWLKRGLHPDQLNPASGVPLHLERRDPDLEPCLAESELRLSDAELVREHRRERWQKVGVALGLAVIAAVVAVLVGSGVLA